MSFGVSFLISDSSRSPNPEGRSRREGIHCDHGKMKLPLNKVDPPERTMLE